MATYEITTPDGKVFQVDGPDNATEEQIVGFAQEHLRTAAPDTEYAKPVYTGEKFTEKNNLVSSTANTLGGLASGAASIVDIPARAVGATLGVAADSLPGVPEWVSDRLKNPATIGGAIDSFLPRPDKGLPALVRSGSEALGGVFGGLGLAQRLSKLAEPVTRGIGNILASLPGQQAGAGLTAGLATEGARQMGAPLPVQLGAGFIAGGVTPSAMRATAGGTDALVDRFSDPGVLNEAARFLRGNISGSEDDVVRSLEMVGPSRSGARPTLAEVTLDPGLAGMQRGVGNLSTQAGARISTRLAENAQTRMGAIDDTLGPGNPLDLERAAQGRQRMLNAQAAAAGEKVGPLVPPDEAGRAARDSLAMGLTNARARTATAYDNPVLQENPTIPLRPLELADVQVPTTPVRPDIAQFQDEAIQGAKGRLPQRPKTLLQWIRQQGGIASDGMGADDLRSSGLDARGQPGLIHKKGVPLDRLREGAAEAGFISDSDDLADFIEYIGAEFSGAVPRFADPDAARLFDMAKSNRDWWRKQFDERDLDPTKMTDAQWFDFYRDVDTSAGQGTTRSLADMDDQAMPGRLMGPFQKTIGAMRDRFFGDDAKEAPAYVRSFFDEVMNADEVGLRTLEGWERQAYDMAGKAPDRQTAAFLQSIGRAIGARASTAGGPERRAALDAARTARREQGRVFEEGAVGRALNRGDFGRFTMRESDVGGALVQKGRSGGVVADQLKEAAGSGAENIARTELRRALDAVADKPLQISRVAREYGEAISRFPALAQDVQTARQSAAVAARFRSTELGRFLGENVDPARAVSQLLTVKDGGRSFRRLVEGPGMSQPALAGIRRAVADHIADISRTSNMDAGLQAIPATAKMAQGIVQTLERTKGTSVLTQSQRGALNAIRRELRGDQFARTANRTTGSDTVRNAGLSFKLFQGAIDIAGSAGPVRNVVEFLFNHLARTEDIINTVTRAVEDPKFAAELLRRPTPDRLERVLEGVRVYNPAAAIGSAASANEVPAYAQ